MSRFSIAAMAVVLGGAGLSACAQKVEAPADKGVCYHVATPTTAARFSM